MTAIRRRRNKLLPLTRSDEYYQFQTSGALRSYLLQHGYSFIGRKQRTVVDYDRSARLICASPRTMRAYVEGTYEMRAGVAKLLVLAIERELHDQDAQSL